MTVRYRSRRIDDVSLRERPGRVRDDCLFGKELLRFVARLLDGEAMTDVCREFGVSRKTGYRFSIPTGSTGWRR
jgi:hypothetical protein